MGLAKLKSQVMQCDISPEFHYTFGASLVQLPEDVSQNRHYSTTITHMVNAGAYPGYPRILCCVVLSPCLCVCILSCRSCCVV